MWERTYAPGAAGSFAVWDADGPGPEPARLYALAGPSEFIVWAETHWDLLGTLPGAWRLEVIDLDGPGPEIPMLFGIGQLGVQVWNGLVWEQFGEPWASGYASGLAAFDLDGSGPMPRSLVAHGRMRLTGSPTTEDFVMWDGHQWAPFGDHLNPSGATNWNIVEGRFSGGTSVYAIAPYWLCGVEDCTSIIAWAGQTWVDLYSVRYTENTFVGLFSHDPDGVGTQRPLPYAISKGRFEQFDSVLAYSPTQNRFGSLLSTEPGSLGAALGFWDFDGSTKVVVATRCCGETPQYPEAARSGVMVRDGVNWRRVGPNGYIREALAIGSHPTAPGDSILFASARSPELPMGDIYRFNPERCGADCDTSTGPGVIDVFDYLCFANAFARGDPIACNCDLSTGDRECDIFDFLCFMEMFNNCGT